MIDFGVLTSAAVAALVPYLKEGGEALFGEAGKNLYTWFADKFKKKDKIQDLNVLGQKPDDQRQQIKFELILEDILKENESLVTELNKLLSEVNDHAKGNTDISKSVNVNTGTITAHGDVMVGSTKTNSGK